MSSGLYACMTTQMRASLFCCSGIKGLFVLANTDCAITVNAYLNSFLYLIRMLNGEVAPPYVINQASEFLIV